MDLPRPIAEVAGVVARLAPDPETVSGGTLPEMGAARTPLLPPAVSRGRPTQAAAVRCATVVDLRPYAFTTVTADARAAVRGVTRAEVSAVARGVESSLRVASTASGADLEGKAAG